MLLIMLLIFCFSGQNGKTSLGVSDGVLAVILQAFSDLLSPAFSAWLVQYIRKVAHFLIYLLLGQVAVASYYTAVSSGRTRLPWYVKGWLTAVLYACTDEFHQLFVPERAGQFADVCLDSAGALLGVVLILILIRIINHRKSHRPVDEDKKRAAP